MLQKVQLAVLVTALICHYGLSEIVDVKSLLPEDGNECQEFEYCGALGRTPCSFDEGQCGPCINGFTEVSGDSRLCRRIRPGERKSDNLIVTSMDVRKRVPVGGGDAAFLVSMDDGSTRAAANRHTITFLILIAMAVFGLLLVGALGLVYHKYTQREIKSNNSARNRKVSYGFEGADDAEEKELARKTQIYHYQHQKRMISSMEQRRAAAEKAGDSSDTTQNADAGSGGESEGPLLLDKVIDGATVTPPPVSSRSSLLRMRSQGSVGSPKEVRSVKMSNQHQSIDRASSVNQKQSTVSDKKSRGGRGGAPADDSEEEVDPDFTVYECPGLAPSGEMEVKNPLFPNNDNANATDEE